MLQELVLSQRGHRFKLFLLPSNWKFSLNFHEVPHELCGLNGFCVYVTWKFFGVLVFLMVWDNSFLTI